MVKTIEITVKNPQLSRKWGWDYSTTPSGDGPHHITPPAKPYYTGTLKKVLNDRERDRTFKNLGGALRKERYFFDKKAIVGWKIDQQIHPIDMFLFDIGSGMIFKEITLVLEDKKPVRAEKGNRYARKYNGPARVYSPYLPVATIDKLKRLAKQEGMSASFYLHNLITSQPEEIK